MPKRYRTKSFGNLRKVKGWKAVARPLKVRSMGLTLASFLAGKGYDHPHSHVFQEEIYILLEGRGEMTVDGKLLHLRPGDAVLVMGAGKSYQIAQGLAAALDAGVLTQPRSL